MFDMNVTGDAHRGVSTMYTITVGTVDARVSVIIVPDAEYLRNEYERECLCVVSVLVSVSLSLSFSLCRYTANLFWVDANLIRT